MYPVAEVCVFIRWANFDFLVNIELYYDSDSFFEAIIS